MDGIDCVFHFAALWLLQCHEFPRTAFDVNIRGTFNVLEGCVAQEVKPSSLFVLGFGLWRRGRRADDGRPSVQQQEFLRRDQDRGEAMARPSTIATGLISSVCAT